MTIQAALAGGVEGEPIRKKPIALRVKEQEALRQQFERAKSDLARFVTAIYQGMTVQAINGASREDLLRLYDIGFAHGPNRCGSRYRQLQFSASMDGNCAKSARFSIGGHSAMHSSSNRLR
jgi:hypothetical protein